MNFSLLFQQLNKLKKYIGDDYEININIYENDFTIKITDGGYSDIYDVICVDREIWDEFTEDEWDTALRIMIINSIRQVKRLK